MKKQSEILKEKNLKRIAIDLSLEVIETLTKLANEDHRNLKNWIEIKLLKIAQGN